MTTMNLIYKNVKIGESDQKVNHSCYKTWKKCYSYINYNMDLLNFY